MLLLNHKKNFSLSYKKAGVDIQNGNILIKKIKSLAKETFKKGVLSDIGGFGALFEISKNYKEPILVSSTDGVGTKLKLAFRWNYHNTIGYDLVAMSVNDILAHGAEPLFFLDYFACGRLSLEIATSVIQSIADACKFSDCSLIGGETAEMPGMYPDGEYDLAGFVVGIVEKSKIINGSSISPGDRILGLASSGAHSNGYSLIRNIIEKIKISSIEKELIEMLMKPTRIYTKSLLPLIKNNTIKGIAHITGGGMIENIPRILPVDMQAVIYKKSWTIPKLFQWIQNEGDIPEFEMFHVFNCGIGMIVIVDQNIVSSVKSELEKTGEIVYEIGEIKKNKNRTSINSLLFI